MKGIPWWLSGIVLSGLLLVTSTPAEAEGPSMIQMIRQLAENVLGPGTVKGVTVTDSGATVLMRWESATYKPENKPQATRDMMYGEAELATGSVLGALKNIARIRFSMMRRDNQMLAGGENRRGIGVVLTFSSLLGGGIYTPPAPKGDSKSGGTSAAKD